MDPDLLGNLLDQHAAALELYAGQWCDATEDVVQDAFLKLAAQRVLPDNPADHPRRRRGDQPGCVLTNSSHPKNTDPARLFYSSR